MDHDDYAEWHDFGKISDGGYIRNHTDKGDTLYGIEMMVHPEYRGLRLSRRLYDARKGLVHDRNLRRIIIGGRIPGYRHYADKMSAREYVEAVMRKSAYDPVLTAQIANGFALKRLIPGYMPGDEQSRGYATFLEWSNVDYVPQRPRRFQPVSLVRICVVQYQLRAIDEFDEFATQCAFFVDVASDNRADFVVFPELFTTQLLSIFEKARRPGGAEPKARRARASIPDSLQRPRGQAQRQHRRRIDVHRRGRPSLQRRLPLPPGRNPGASGQAPRHPGGDQVVGPRARGSPRRLPDRRGPRGDPPRQRHRVSRAGGAIAASKGAELLFVPFSADERSGYLRVRTCAQARAIENDVYVAIAPCVGNLPFVANVDGPYAQSGIYTPADFSFPRDGIAAECPANIETLIVTDVDLEILSRHRSVGVSLNWSEPRRDLYRVHYQEDGESHVI